jgi:hypothetical protein
MQNHTQAVVDNEQVQRITGEIRVLVKRTAGDIVEIGLRLIEVKIILGHGLFGDWLQAEFGWTHQTANNFMTVANRFGQNPKFLEFPPSVLYLLASNDVPQAALDNVLNCSDAGEHITCKLTKKIIERAKHDQRLIAIEQHTPDSIQQMLKDGILSIEDAHAIAEGLEKSNEPVCQLIARWGISDPNLIPILERLHKNKSETFDELSFSGFIQPGEEEEAIPLQCATARQLQEYLDIRQREHALQALVQRAPESSRIPSASPTLIVAQPDFLPDIEDETIDLIILSTPEIQPEVLHEFFRVAKFGASLFLHRQLQNDLIMGSYSFVSGYYLSQQWMVRQEIIWDSGRSRDQFPGYFYPVDERIYWLTKGDPILPKNRLGASSIWRPYNPDGRYLPLSLDEITKRSIEALGWVGMTILFPGSGYAKSLDLAFASGCNVIGMVNSVAQAEDFRNKFRWSNKSHFSGQTGT